MIRDQRCPGNTYSFKRVQYFITHLKSYPEVTLIFKTRQKECKLLLKSILSQLSSRGTDSVNCYSLLRSPLNPPNIRTAAFILTMKTTGRCRVPNQLFQKDLWNSKSSRKSRRKTFKGMPDLSASDRGTLWSTFQTTAPRRVVLS